MRIYLNGQERVVPSSLSEITLGQRIEFQREHGDLLHKMQESLEEIKDPFERELEEAELALEKIFRTMSFFTGTTVAALKDEAFIHQVISIYQATMQQVFLDEQQVIENPEYEFVFNHEEWVLHPPELKNGSPMKFGEFVDSKQTIQNMVGLSRNRWECLLPLCAIFLRKKEEPYREEFLYEGSERQQLLMNLPLDIALQVGFFLSSSLSSFAQVSQSLGNQESRGAEDLQRSTSTSSVG